MTQVGAPTTLHRVNGYDALTALMLAALDVRGGRWVAGAPSHVLTELLGALEARGFYLGVKDQEQR